MSAQPPPPLTGPQIIAVLKNAEANFEARAEIWNHQTRIIRAKYVMLRDKGFDDAQALELCYKNWDVL